MSKADRRGNFLCSGGFLYFFKILAKKNKSKSCTLAFIMGVHIDNWEKKGVWIMDISNIADIVVGLIILQVNHHTIKEVLRTKISFKSEKFEIKIN